MKGLLARTAVAIAWMPAQRLRALLYPLLFVALAVPAAAVPPPLTEEQTLPGDLGLAGAVASQDFARVAAGGPGYLVVWEDERPVLGNFVFTDQPLTGNGIDIYAARLDSQGQLLDESPIVICQLGRNQSKPQVAWNEAADAWLVTWATERPDWYFAHDIVAARVSADGALLDPVPILLRAESDTPANDYGRNPTVASDGQDWIVAWEDQVWVGGQPRSNLVARRVSASGALVDPTAVLYQHPDGVFGPIVPHVAWAGNEYLLVWERAGFYDLYGRLIGPTLAPMGPEFVITSSGYGPRVASNGVDFLVVSRYARVHRVTHAGVSLDPGGIPLDVFPANEYRGPDVAWAGTEWLVACASPRQYPLTQAIFLSRVTPSGTLAAPSVALSPSGADQRLPSIAASEGGLSRVVWTERDFPGGAAEDIRGTMIGNGVPVSNEMVSTGWSRQQRVRFATNGSEHVAVFASETSGTCRILAQRIDAMGTPIDAEPVEIARSTELAKIFPDVAWNGSVYLVAWCKGGTVFARRLASDMALLDPAPVALVSDVAGSVGVGALGPNFLLAYDHTFSGDQVSLRAFAVRGSDLVLLGGPVTLGGDFVEQFPRVRTLSDRWFVTWVHRPTHDSPASSVRGAFVDASVVPLPEFTISGSGYGFEADVAVGDDRALVVYIDNAEYVDAQVEARLVNADGSFATGEFLVCDAPKHQRFAACGWDGTQFFAAWTDFRGLGIVDHLRGDTYAARIDGSGAVLDPNGFQVTTGPLPEDLPAVVGGGGTAIIAYCVLDGGRDDEVQRIGYRTTAGGTTGVDLPAAVVARLRSWPNPFRSSIGFDFSNESGSRPSRVEIIGADGRRIRTLVLSSRAGGIGWDGRDAAGHAVPAGVYFVKASFGEKLLTTRIVRID